MKGERLSVYEENHTNKNGRGDSAVGGFDLLRKSMKGK